eukprot:gene272-1601_t
MEGLWCLVPGSCCLVPGTSRFSNLRENTSLRQLSRIVRALYCAQFLHRTAGARAPDPSWPGFREAYSPNLLVSPQLRRIASDEHCDVFARPPVWRIPPSDDIWESGLVVCTLGPKSREVPVLEELLAAGMSMARFNFSHGSHDCHQGTLDNIRKACANTGKMCSVMLDTKGPEIRTGMLKDSKPVQLTTGQEINITTDYNFEGTEETIAMSYKKLAEDVKPGSQILIADGSIVLEVLTTNPSAGSVRCKCLNIAVL